MRSAFLFTLCARTTGRNDPGSALVNDDSSRISHAGDQVEGSTIAPVSLRGQILIPQGSRVLGSSVKRFGLGLKHVTASIHYRFHTVRLTSGETIRSRLKFSK